MSGYPLQSLLTVRTLRETNARNELRKAEHAVTAADENVRQCQNELERYRAWRIEEEERRYDTLMGVATTQKELNEFHGDLATLRMGDTKRELAVHEAIKNLEACRQHVLATRDAIAKARRDVAKVQTLKDIWLEEQRHEAARREDLEMEEFKPTAPADNADDI